jgi:hypothetical protein
MLLLDPSPYLTLAGTGVAPPETPGEPPVPGHRSRRLASHMGGVLALLPVCLPDGDAGCPYYRQCDVALAHWLWRFTGMAKDHPAMQTRMPATAGYQRRHGRWQIVPETSQAAFTLEP